MLAANAEILIQKNARAGMVNGKQPGLPRITFGDEGEVFLGGKEVQAHYLGRGHTNGDAVMLFPAERVLHTGDLFVNGQSPSSATAGMIERCGSDVVNRERESESLGPQGIVGSPSQRVFTVYIYKGRWTV